MSEAQGQNGPEEKIPAIEGKAEYRVGYGKPPLETRFLPGTSGNPGGSRTAGAYVQEHINALVAQDLTEEQIAKIARDPAETWKRRTAAIELLKTLEHPDIADYAGLLSGENRPEDLRAMKINTAVIKRLKQKTRKVPVGDKLIEEVVDREIEFYDRAGQTLDRICDRTNGRPKQSVEMSGKDGGPIPLQFDLTKLTDDELNVLEAAQNRARVGSQPDPDSGRADAPVTA